MLITICGSWGRQVTKENLLDAINASLRDSRKCIANDRRTRKRKARTGRSGPSTSPSEVEKSHAALYQKALDSLSKDTAAIDYYVCSVCVIPPRAMPR